MLIKLNNIITFNLIYFIFCLIILPVGIKAADIPNYGNTKLTTYWKFKPQGRIWAKPVAYDNYIYFGTDYGLFYALDTVSGRLIWKINIDGKIFQKPFYYNGKIYFATLNNQLYAVDAFNGRILWCFHGKGNFGIAPVCFNREVIYSSDKKVLALNYMDGQTNWSFECEANVNACLINEKYLCISTGIPLVFPDKYGPVYIFNSITKKLLCTYYGNDSVSSNFIQYGQDIYFWDEDNIIKYKPSICIGENIRVYDSYICYEWNIIDDILYYEGETCIHGYSLGEQLEKWSLRKIDTGDLLWVGNYGGLLFINRKKGKIEVIDIYTGNQKDYIIGDFEIARILYINTSVIVIESEGIIKKLKR